MHPAYKRIYSVIFSAVMLLSLAVAPASAQSANNILQLKLVLVDVNTNDVVTSATTNIAVYIRVTNNTPNTIQLGAVTTFSPLDLFPLNKVPNYYTYGYEFNLNNLTGGNGSIFNGDTLLPGETFLTYLGTVPVSSATVPGTNGKQKRGVSRMGAGFYTPEFDLIDVSNSNPYHPDGIYYQFSQDLVHVGTAISAELY